MEEPRVLVIDDEEAIHLLVERALPGFELFHAFNAHEGSRVAREQAPEVLLLDLNLPGPNGFALLEEVRALRIPSEVLVLTAFPTRELAFEAGRRGARAFLSKTDKTFKELPEHVRAAVGREFPSIPVVPETRSRLDQAEIQIIESSRSAAVQSGLESLLAVEAGVAAILVAERGVSLRPWAKLAYSHFSDGRRPFEQVFVEGRSLTRALPNLDRAFVFVDDVHALPATAHDELVKHALSAGGPPSLVLGMRGVPGNLPRVLDAAARAGLLRPTVEVPPLRRRREDIPALLDEVVLSHPMGPGRVSEEAKIALVAYDWPGNEQELDELVADVAAADFGLDAPIEPRDLPPHVIISSLHGRDPGTKGLFARLRASYERLVVRRALRRCGGDRRAAADMLGISRSTLKAKLRTED